MRNKSKLRAALSRIKPRFPTLASFYGVCKSALIPPISIDRSELVKKELIGSDVGPHFIDHSKYVVILSFDELMRYAVRDNFWDRVLSYDKCKQRFGEGQTCYAAVDGDRLIAMAWCTNRRDADLFPPLPRRFNMKNRYIMHGVLVHREHIVKRNITVNLYLSCCAFLRSKGAHESIAMVWRRNKFGKHVAERAGFKQFGFVDNIKILNFHIYRYRIDKL